MTHGSPGSASLSIGQRMGFAMGDLAGNFYWQSFQSFLLFYYTESVGLTPTTAGAIIMLASLWDGLIDPFIGAAADRTRTRWGAYRPYLLLGAPVLGVAFVLQYYRPPFEGIGLLIFVTATHFFFRSAYAMVNVPYVALSARITQDTAERSLLAGLRMLFATVAGIVVVAATQPVVAAVTERAGGQGYMVAAMIFALMASALFPIVFAVVREAPPDHAASSARPTMAGIYRSVIRNRAFWTVIVGLCCLTLCATALMKSVLYYYKYRLLAEDDAKIALMLGVGSALVYVPALMAAARRFGKRSIWLASCVAGLGGLAVLALVDIDRPWQMCAFIVYMHLPITGLGFGFWSMIPDTVEYGEWRSGVRAEAFIFGIGGFFAKSALGVSVFVFGAAFDAVGFVANQAQSASTLDGMKQIMVVMPAAGFAVAFVAMSLNPLRRGVHEAIVQDLRNGLLAVSVVPTPPSRS